MDYETRNSLLKDSYWFAEHDQLDTAISLIDEAFDNFLEFRAWWLTESNPEYSLFDVEFCKWVGKIMVMFWWGHTIGDDSEILFLTYCEIYKD